MIPPNPLPNMANQEDNPKRRGRPPLSDKRIEAKITLPPIVHSKATKLAQKRGKSLSDLAEEAIKKLVEDAFWQGEEDEPPSREVTSPTPKNRGRPTGLEGFSLPPTSVPFSLETNTLRIILLNARSFELDRFHSASSSNLMPCG